MPLLTTAGPAVLEARGLAKRFRDGKEERAVLRDVTFSVAAGELLSIEGPSGSGKSTLLMILGCLLSPSAGEVWIGGQRVPSGEGQAVANVRRRSIGFVFQSYQLFPSLTCLENVMYALQLRGRHGSEVRTEALRSCEAVGLSDRLHMFPRELSGGQRQRVGIARAIAGGAPVLLADEPTANLDSALGASVLELFSLVARNEARAVILVTHDAQVRTVADRVLIMRDGTLSVETERQHA